MSNGKFLSYLPSLKSLAVLTRQPPARFLSAAENLQEATSGYVRSVVDPGRGVLIALYGERPDVAERIEQGQEVGYVIIAVGLIGAALLGLPVHLPDPHARESRGTAERSRPSERRQPAGSRAARIQRRYVAHRRRLRNCGTAHFRSDRRRNSEDRTLPGVPATRRCSRSVAGTDRYGHRDDPDVPEHHRVRFERSETDGPRYQPGDDRDGTRPRYRNSVAVRQRDAEFDLAAARGGAGRSEFRVCSPK